MRARRFTLYPAVFLSFILTHELTYFILYPNNGLRFEILTASGHSWMHNLPLLTALALLFTIYGIWQSRPRLLNKYSQFKITTIQYLSFLSVEILERALAGEKNLPELKILLVGLLLSFFSSFIISLFFEKIISKVVERLKREAITNESTTRLKVEVRADFLIFGCYFKEYSPRSPPFVRSL